MPSLASAASVALPYFASDGCGAGDAASSGLALAFFVALRLTPYASSQIQDSVDLQQRATRQSGNPDGSARRIGLRKIGRHELIDARKMGQVGQIHGELHCMVQTTAGRGCDGFQVLEDPINLRFYAFGHLHARGLKSNLAREVNHITAS